MLRLSFGLTSAHATGLEECTNRDCIEEQLAQNGEFDEEALIAKLESLIASIQEKIGAEKIQNAIKTAAESNPQIAELLALVQDYGILTDIDLDSDPTTTAAAE